MVIKSLNRILFVNDHFSEYDMLAMQHALRLAESAALAGEVPVGAVVYEQNIIIGEGENRMIRDCDPSAHAEINALRNAARQQQNYRLPQFKMAVTLEPCMMCAGAVFLARLHTLVFAANDPKTGAVGSVSNLHEMRQFNPHTRVVGGLLADESAKLLREFFQVRR